MVPVWHARVTVWLPPPPPNDSINEHVALSVADAIERADRTKAWVARKADIPLTTFTRKISGKSAFTIPELARIAQAIGVSASALLPREFATQQAA